MNRKIQTFLMTALLLAASLPAWAGHGEPATRDRDAWINRDLTILMDSGLVSQPSKPVEQLTNLEVAQLTDQAALQVAQANSLPPLDLPAPAAMPGIPEAPPAASAPGQSSLPGMVPQASRSLKELVEEFRSELTAQGLNVDKLEDKLSNSEGLNDLFAALQRDYLKRTGTDVNGFSRGFMNNYRGFGGSPAYPPMDYNAAIFMQMELKSIPVPNILFDAQIRFWRSIGMYYQDPIQPEFQLHWISLTNVNDVANITAGDFYKHYTPLTLWDSDAPLYTFIEPSSFHRNRMDTEELVYLDHAPDWHFRGFQASTGKSWDKDVLSGFGAQIMTGVVRDATSFTFGSYYAGSQDSLRLLKNDVEVTATGLLLWQDPSSANVPYVPGDPNTYAKQYQVASLSAQAKVDFDDKTNLSFSAENAFTQYTDDANNPQSNFQDWALLAKGTFTLEGLHLTAKYVDVGPYFYSPGAQTNAYTPNATGFPYLTSTMFGIDDALPGYLNGFVFQDVNRPSYALYDRLSENILPYGDATPNRQGLILGLSAEIGKGGWLKPQASYDMSGGSLGLQEKQANLIAYNPNPIPADGNPNPRTFSGYEGAVSADLAKFLDMSSQTLVFQGDYKHQETDLNDAAGDSLLTNNLILAADFSIPAPIIKPLVWSVAFEQTTGSGKEYVLNGRGNPPSLASYDFFLANAAYNDLVNDPTNLVFNYQLTTLDITRTTLAFGFKFPFSNTINFRGDYFLTNYSWASQPAYSRYDNILRFTYEAHF